MRIKTTIYARIGEFDGAEAPYGLLVEVVECGKFPTYKIFHKDGSIKVAEYNGKSEFFFKGSYEDVIYQKRKVLDEIERALNDWMKNFPYPEEKKIYIFRDGKIIPE